jgi:hypothetical protein
MRSLLRSPRRVHADRNQDFDVIVDETVADHGMAIEKAMVEAQRLNDAHGDKLEQRVHWREVIGLPMPEGVTMSIEGKTKDDPEPPAVPGGAKPGGKKRAA